ncbi:MAG TPA: P-II family nitrogen regulator [Fimbriimonadales bacterium]|nr:P-II family nitrogen regulator [Fimbriimonadales bacterium]
MFRIIAYIRPHKLEEVKTALAEKGVTGLTVTDARGCGSSPEPTEWFLGESYVVSLPARIKLEAVVPDSMRETAVETILRTAHTGRSGDGKIVVLRELDAVRVRTGERGEQAL